MAGFHRLVLLIALGVVVLTMASVCLADSGTDARSSNPSQRQTAQTAPTAAPPNSAPVPAQLPGMTPRWLDDVRAQRQAQQELRRAHADARKDEFLRRRQEIRDKMNTDRRLFLNQGPWLNPLAPAQLPPALPPHDHGMANGSDDGTTDDTPAFAPPGWNNGWYYNGW